LAYPPRHGALPFLVLFLFIKTTFPAAVPLLAQSIQGQSWLTAANAMLEKGEYAEGIALFHDRLRSAGSPNRDTLEAYRYLTLFYWYADRDREAIENCQIVLRDMPGAGSARLQSTAPRE
jgi:hypothetical protein